MKKRKKGRRFTISAVQQAPELRAIEMKPEELAMYVRRAEQEVLPIIEEGRWNTAPPSINGCEHRQMENWSNGHSICYCIPSSFLTTLLSTCRKDGR